MIILPRQARGKHKENSKKSGGFLQRAQGCERVGDTEPDAAADGAPSRDAREQGALSCPDRGQVSGRRAAVQGAGLGGARRYRPLHGGRYGATCLSFLIFLLTFRFVLPIEGSHQFENTISYQDRLGTNVSKHLNEGAFLAHRKSPGACWQRRGRLERRSISSSWVRR
jgi:hypothetical protein